MHIIPAIDVLDGNVVRLRQGDFARVTTYGDDPLRFAREYRKAGATKLHLVNLSGAKSEGIDESFRTLLRSITSETQMELQVGGGMRTVKDVQAMLDAGAAKVVIGTMLFKNPAAVRAAVNLFGADRVIAALDVQGEEVKIHGWQTGSGVDLFTACRLAEEIGIGEILVTDISLDGMSQGPSMQLYERLTKSFPLLSIIASGGVRSADDITALARAGLGGVVVGKALLDGSLPVSILSDNASAKTAQPIKPANRSTLAVRIIPCLDVTGGRVVKGTSFQNLRDAGNPIELAKRYCEEGADELVFLDITATSDNRETTYELAARVADAINIPFTIGGGIRSVDDARRILEAGADKVTVNSAAVKNPSLLADMAEQLGRANTVCAIDAKRKGKSWPAGRSSRTSEGWTVLVRGGRDDTNIDAIAWAEEAVRLGAGELLVTSFDRDGTGEGFDTDLLSEIKQRVSVPVIASGGAGSLDSFVKAVSRGKADAVLAATVFHFGTFSIRDVKLALQAASVPVRL